MIFADTSFWVALQTSRDTHHQEARELLARFEGHQITTSNHVVGETWTFIRRRSGHSNAVAFIDSINQSPRVSLITVSEKLERESLEWLRAHDERVYSYVDATSFALMRAHKIRKALAFNADFSAAGFVELRI